MISLVNLFFFFLRFNNRSHIFQYSIFKTNCHYHAKLINKYIKIRYERAERDLEKTKENSGRKIPGRGGIRSRKKPSVGGPVVEAGSRINTARKRATCALTTGSQPTDGDRLKIHSWPRVRSPRSGWQEESAYSRRGEMGWTTLRAQVVSTIYTALNTHLLGHLPPLSFSVHHFQKKRKTKKRRRKRNVPCAISSIISLSLSLYPSISISVSPLLCGSFFSSSEENLVSCRVVSLL